MVKENAMKQTEIGLIPEDWQVVNIQSLIDDNFILHHIDGNHGALYPKSSEFKRAGIPYVGANSLINGKIDYKNVKYLSEERCLAFQKGVAKPHDLLFAHNATVGPVGLVDSKYEKVILSTTLTYFRCNSEFLCGKFLLYEFQSNRFIRQYSAVMSQSTRNQVPISAQRKFQIPVPPLIEQEAIAAALSDCDAWIESLEAVIAKKRLIKQGAMQELLTPKEDWEVKKLGDLIDVLADYTANGSFESLKNNVKYYSTKNFAVLVRTTDLDKKFFVPERFTDELGYKFLSKTSLFGGELILANVGSIGKVFKVPEYNMPMTLAPNTYMIKLYKDFSQEYVYQWMKSDEFINKLLSKVGSSTLMAINKDNLREINMKIPKSLSEQTRIATVLSDMDAELEALGQKLNKARQLKQGMMQELLTGRVRLV